MDRKYAPSQAIQELETGIGEETHMHHLHAVIEDDRRKIMGGC